MGSDEWGMGLVLTHPFTLYWKDDLGRVAISLLAAGSRCHEGNLLEKKLSKVAGEKDSK